MQKRWAAAGVVVVVVAAGGTWWALRDHGRKPAAPAVVTAAADTGEVTVQVAATGTVQPATTRSLSFTAAGTVESVRVRPGSKVAAGAVLATIDDTDAAKTVSDAQDALDDAEDRLDSAKAADASASATPSPSPTPSKSARAAGITGGNAAGKPATSGGKTQATPAAQATPAQTRAAGNGNGTDQVLSAEQQVNQDRETLQNAEATLAGTTIKAPIRGTVLTVAGKVGTQAGAGSAFVTLADTYHWQVDADFPEADAGAIAVGQSATVGLADHPGETYPATVVQVDPVGTSDGTMVRYGVVLSFVTAPDDLLVGQSAQTTIVTGQVKNTLRVPSTAVHDVTNGAGTVRVGGVTRTVRVGLRGDQYTQITGGLTAGDLVERSW